jgi:para-aminobenzoate synthetase
MPSVITEDEKFPASAPLVDGAESRKSILYVDAYDSFSNNVISMLEENLKVEVTVLTVDSEWPNGDMLQFIRGFDAVVLGPGPGNPECAADVGIMRDLWSLEGADLVPILGICLGFQSLCLHHGMSIRELPLPLHGQVHRIDVLDEDIFTGLQNFEVTLYHSLYATVYDVDSITSEDPSAYPVVESLSFLAWLSAKESDFVARKIPMAVRHNQKPFWGFQFHPESCKSDAERCIALLKRWWESAADFNTLSKRSIGSSSTKRPRGSSGLPSIYQSIQASLFELTSASSERCTYRSVPLQDLCAEKIFELLNAPGSPSVLFQSNGRFNVMSAPSPSSWRLEYSVLDETLQIEGLNDASACRSQSHVTVDELWEVLKELMSKRKILNGNQKVPFWGGFLGYFTYEMGLAGLAHPKTSPRRASESEQTARAPQEECSPDVSLLWVDRSIVIDNLSQTIYIQSTREADDLQDGWLDKTCQQIKGFCRAHSLQDITHRDVKILEADHRSLLTSAERELIDSLLEGSTVDTPDETTYKSKVLECQTQMKAGESYELCLTGETTITLPPVQDVTLGDLRPWLLYKKLKTYNPAAFSAYARLGSVKIASSSPECFLNWDRQSTLEMKPMKGTVRKSPGMTLEKAKAILGSTKEMAENLMIADLIRHDLYGICGSGNVRVEKLLEVEDHGRVYQMITHVKGIVPHVEGISMSHHGITALQRCLPPGSMTGAPKERSCMHLETIEARQRGIYSGVMGYLDLGGAGSFSVLIRTAFSCAGGQSTQPELWRLGAGGAVTILSTAEGEWDEMVTKLRTVVNVFKPVK